MQNKALQLLFEDTLDIGEASALALAFEMQECTIILDDLKARKTAAKMNMKVTGTMGVIVKAKQEKTISSARNIIKR